MMIVPLILAAAAGVAAGPAVERPGPQIASAGARAEILRPAIVRQASGPQQLSRDAPQPRVVRRDGRVLVEFQ